MTRKAYIQRVLRQIYGGYIPDDSEITYGMVNNILGDAIALAAKANYIDSVKLDAIGYINNGFYTKYKGLSITEDEQFLWKVELPEIPVGIGQNEGAETLILKDSSSNQLSFPVIFITQKQRGFNRGRRQIPNKTIGYFEGGDVFLESTLMLSNYTAQITMVSGGVSSDLDSELNIPADYFATMNDYILKQLAFEQSRIRDTSNDGADGGDKQ